MIRYKMSILLFLFSTLLLTTFAFEAQAQDNPEVQKILAQIDKLENKRAELVLYKTVLEQDIQRLNVQLLSIQSDISDTLDLISALEAELAMAVNDADRRRLQARLQQAKSRLNEYQKKYQKVLAKKTFIEKKIRLLDKRIADIDNQLMKFYARLFELI